MAAAVMQAGPTGGNGLRPSAEPITPVTPSLFDEGMMGSGQLGVNTPPPPPTDPTTADLETRVQGLSRGGG